jgi:hypothetical protein
MEASGAVLMATGGKGKIRRKPAGGGAQTGHAAGYLARLAIGLFAKLWVPFAGLR